MATTVVKRPQGKVIAPASISTATVSDSGLTSNCCTPGATRAYFNQTSHGLSQDDVIIIFAASTSIKTYLGTWYVQDVGGGNPDIFAIGPTVYPSCEIAFEGACDVYYYQIGSGSTFALMPTIQNASGDVQFSLASHGLSTGDFIFIESDYPAYNGFWYAQVSSSSLFKIREYATATVKSYVAGSGDTVTFFKSILTHGWSCVHLPIKYKISNDRWPINTIDTARTVSSYANDNGYVELTLSGGIKGAGSGVATELDFVKITNANGGIYQIIKYTSTSVITIDMPYNSGISFSGSTVQFYYKDYHVRVRVFAGLKSTHNWAAIKPYAQIIELKLVPDATGIVDFDISEYLKSKINVNKLNVIFDTSPNDISAFTMFYISVAESYTSSNTYSLQTTNSTFTSDQSTFEGFAVNSKLPFKNRHAGYLSDFIIIADTNPHFQQFLTSFRRPKIFKDQYFDLSVLFGVTATNKDFIFEVKYWYITAQGTPTVGETVQTSFSKIASTLRSGILRFPVEYKDGYNTTTKKNGYEYATARFYNSTDAVYETEIFYIDIGRDWPDFFDENFAIDSNYTSRRTEITPDFVDLSWLNAFGGYDHWRFYASKQLAIETTKEETTTNINTNWPTSYGQFADTIRSHSNINATKTYLIRSQPVDKTTAQNLAGIHSSLLVQIVGAPDDTTGYRSKRTVLVEPGSFAIVEDTDKLVEISFKVKFTDELPSQKL